MIDLMVTKWSVKNPLTIEERKKISEALELNMSYGQMAVYVGRSKSTVLRECRRLGHTEDYDPDKAQKHFEDIQLARRNGQKKDSRRRDKRISGDMGM